MTDSTVILRPARKSDARVIAELAQIAGEGIPAWFWAQDAAPGEDLLAVGARNVLSETENFSYRNAHLAEVDGAVASLLLAYRLPDADAPVDLDQYPAFIRPLIELEQEVPGSFYLNMLATFPAYRNRALGSRLLQHANTLAGQAGCDTLSLQVFEQNPGALRLYLRHGYRPVARRAVVPHPSHHYRGELVLLTRPVTA
jgi:ribosomal protein S18 acetylase RimI-like enzyme